MHAAALKGFVRYGSRWGWKLGLFAGIFTMGRTLSSVYRNKDDVFNYVVAGSEFSMHLYGFVSSDSFSLVGVTGGVFKVRHGIKPVIGGAFLGFLLRLATVSHFRWVYSNCTCVFTTQLTN